MRERIVALLWGFAEATLFFFVPDVYLTFVALRDVRLALVCCAWALAGALAGGSLMYLWGVHDPAQVAAVLDWVPAISRGSIARVRDQLQTIGLPAVVLAPLSGTPYKIYAAEAGAIGLGLGRLLLITVPARLVRFALVSLLAAAVTRMPPLRSWSPRALRRTHLLVWAVFYGLYFALVPW
jgi:membrane protein YqaA with SNARE-associated domain